MKFPHWFHTWSKWNLTRVDLVSTKWTAPGYYAYREQTQQRTCEVCGLTQTKKEIV